MTENTRQPAFRSHDHRAQLEATLERALDRYAAAVNRHRYGSTPAIREAARAEALRIRPLIHPGR